MAMCEGRQGPVDRRERAFALIEQAIAVSLLLLLILGSLDISNVLSAYQALQVGVQAALRDCYSVDGKCARPVKQDTTSIYKVWQKPILGFEQDYEARAWFLMLPNVMFEHPSARVVSSYRNSYMRNKGQLSLLSWRTEADLYFAEQRSKLPDLVALSSSHHASLSLDHTSEVSLSAQCSISGPGGQEIIPDNGTFSDDAIRDALPKYISAKASRNSVHLVTISCVVPSPFALLPEPQRSAVRQCLNPLAGDSPCDGAWKTRTRVAFVVKGESFDSRSRGTDHVGKIGVSISQAGNSSMRGSDRGTEACEKAGTCACANTTCQYGGADFSGNREVNLIPRGIPSDQVAAGLTDRELQDHRVISVLYDTPFRISMSLSALDAGKPVSWRMKGFRMYKVGYSPADETVQCEGLARKSAISKGTAPCYFRKDARTALQGVQAFNLRIASAAPEVSTVGGGACFDPIRSGAQSAAERARDWMCAAIGDLANCTADYTLSFSPDSSCGEFKDAERACPANSGVAPGDGEKFDGKRYYFSDSPSARSVCSPLASEIIDPAASLVSTVWYEKDVPLPPVRKDFQGADCLFLASPILSDYSAYRNFKPGPYTITGSTVVGLGRQMDPRIEKRVNPRYTCPEVSAAYESQRMQNAEDFGCEWKGALCSAMTENKQIRREYFCEASSKSRSRRQQAEKFFESPAELDACLEYQVLDDAEHSAMRKYLGIVNGEGYPAECTPMDPRDPLKRRRYDGRDWCAREQAGVITAGGGGLAKTESPPGIEAVRTFFPRARTSCANKGEEYCLDFPPVGMERDEAGTIFDVTASINIPVRLLFSHSVKLTHSDRRVWEGEFAR